MGSRVTHAPADKATGARRRSGPLKIPPTPGWPRVRRAESRSDTEPAPSPLRDPRRARMAAGVARAESRSEHLLSTLAHCVIHARAGIAAGPGTSALPLWPLPGRGCCAGAHETDLVVIGAGCRARTSCAAQRPPRTGRPARPCDLRLVGMCAGAAGVVRGVRETDVVVIGAGQAGLSSAYLLRARGWTLPCSTPTRRRAGPGSTAGRPCGWRPCTGSSTCRDALRPAGAGEPAADAVPAYFAALRAGVRPRRAPAGDASTRSATGPAGACSSSPTRTAGRPGR